MKSEGSWPPEESALFLPTVTVHFMESHFVQNPFLCQHWVLEAPAEAGADGVGAFTQRGWEHGMQNSVIFLTSGPRLVILPPSLPPSLFAPPSSFVTWGDEQPPV